MNNKNKSPQKLERGLPAEEPPQQGSKERTRQAFEADINHPWVTVAEYISPSEADMSLLRLELAGIDSYLDNESITSINAMENPNSSSIRLQVRLNHVPAASKVLALATAKTCPACKSPKIFQRPLPWWLLALAVLCLTIPLWFVKRSWQCDKCGHTWD